MLKRQLIGAQNKKSSEAGAIKHVYVCFTKRCFLQAVRSSQFNSTGPRVRCKLATSGLHNLLQSLWAEVRNSRAESPPPSNRQRQPATAVFPPNIHSDVTVGPHGPNQVTLENIIRQSVITSHGTIVMTIIQFEICD